MIARLIIAAVMLALAAPCLAGTPRTSRFEYDAQGWLIREIIEPGDPALCLVTTYVLDSHGNRTSATTRNCNGTSSNGVIEAAAPTGDPVFTPRTSTSTYAAGSDANGAWIEGQFATSITNALGHLETRTYDPRFGGVLSLVGPNNLTTRWTYDSFGRKASETRADGTVTNWFYERCVDLPAGTCSNLHTYRVRVAATGAPTTSTYYDSHNREMRTETQGFDGTLARKDTTYDGLGRVGQVSRPYYVGEQPGADGLWGGFGYDILGRVTLADEPSTTSPAGAVRWARTTTTYSGLTTTLSVTDPTTPNWPTQTRTLIKNSQGQVVQVKDTQNNTLTYIYDEFGNLKTTTDALGNVTTMNYDLRGRKTTMVDPDMGSWSYVYNAASDLIRQTDAKNQITTMVPDPLARVISRTEPDLVSTWTYDNCTKGIGKLCQASASNGYSRTYTYDPLGRLQTLNASIDTAYAVSTTYVASGAQVGKVDTLTYPTGFGVRNTYNAFGYLSEVRVANPGGNSAFAADGTLLWRATAMSASGNVTGELLGGNGSSLTQTRNFDALNRLRSVVASGSGGTVHNLAYTYDTIGNIIQRVDNVDGITENFAYDNLNRLLSASGSGLVTRSFDYNAIGNMTYKSDVGTYAYPASGAGGVRPHAVSSVSGTVSASYTYDASGNLTSGAGRSVTYMSFNMPATIAGSAATYTYTYSPEHERVKLITQLATGTQTSIYLHPGGAGTLLYEKQIKLDSSLEHKHYVNAGSLLVGVYVIKSTYVSGDGPQMRYYHSDNLGSIMAITNESGAVVERLAYEPFGKRRFPSGTADPNNTIFGITTDRGFTEQEHLDELELIHMNGRVYDPLLARFMTPDTGVPYPFNLQSFNRYSYTRNNPLVLRDPSGFDDEDPTPPPPPPLPYLNDVFSELANVVSNYLNQAGTGVLSTSDASWANATPSSVLPPTPGTQGSDPGQGLVMGLGNNLSQGRNGLQFSDAGVPSNCASGNGVCSAQSASEKYLHAAGASFVFTELYSRAFEYSNVRFGEWLGNNGKWYSLDWGGNQWAGARSAVENAAGKFELAGRAALGLGLAVDTIQFARAAQSNDMLGATGAFLNATISAATAFGGPVGWAIGVGYFGLEITGVRASISGGMTDVLCVGSRNC